MGRLLRGRLGRCPEPSRRGRAGCAERHKPSRPMTKITPRPAGAPTGSRLGLNSGRAVPNDPAGGKDLATAGPRDVRLVGSALLAVLRCGSVTADERLATALPPDAAP